uniref:Uncharacterized protein n=1 Tax=Lactuca sativa TaxID=4236 RepID=A0A9R1XW54_LACSA|nr:hypothetical protein LSAT_V11C200089000 [Lactuca sativa]
MDLIRAYKELFTPCVLDLYDESLDLSNSAHAIIINTTTIYSSYWLTIARCPPLTFRLVDMSAKKAKRNPFKSKKTNEVILEEITEEEFHEGYTIASALNFKLLGLSASISDNGNDHFGDVTDLSPLADMDGSLGVSAYDADKKCMRLFVSSKATPYQFVPTKVMEWIVELFEAKELNWLGAITSAAALAIAQKMGQDISIGSTSVGRSAAIVSNMSVEILVPQTVIALVYEGEWKQPHSFKTGAKVVVHEPRSGTSDHIVHYHEHLQFMLGVQRGAIVNVIQENNKKTRNIGSKNKRLLMHNEDAMELKVTWEEAHELLHPPPTSKPTLSMIENCEFEEYDITSNGDVVVGKVLPELNGKLTGMDFRTLLSHMLKISNGYVYDVERLDEEIEATEMHEDYKQKKVLKFLMEKNSVNALHRKT